jgi:hypothetical protein
MAADPPLFELLPATSYLEHAFVRWVLTPALRLSVRSRVTAQEAVVAGARTYRLDYARHGETARIAIELDGFA